MKFLKNKRSFTILALLFAMSFTTVSTTSCARRVGCEAENNVGPKTDRQGNLKMTRGKSQLFSNKQKKRKRKKRR